MANLPTLPGWKDKVLFTPGPLTTSQTVKQAMLRDLGSRDHEFIDVVKDIRRRLLGLAGVTDLHFTAIPLQGSGTYGIEAVLGSAVGPDAKLLIASNGAYGERLTQIAERLRITTHVLRYPEDQPIAPADVQRVLEEDADITTVAVVHCETSTGIFNPIEELGPIVHNEGRHFIVDAMSSFGAVPIDVARLEIDYLVSSSNKCIEGVPGFCFVIANTDHLERTAGWARGFCFDLLAQYKGLESSGQFRFTPPTHSLLAFHQALLELEKEGGIAARAQRYQNNYRTLMDGMSELGFNEFLPRELQGYIITSFYYPKHPKFQFQTFYDLLQKQGYVIYPGKLSKADCFRIGNIGRINQNDVQDLLSAIRRVLGAMGISPIPLTA